MIQTKSNTHKQPSFTPGMPNSWNDLNISNVFKNRVNSSALLHLQQKSQLRLKQKKSILHPAYASHDFSTISDDNLLNDFDQSTKSFYSFIQTSSKSFFNQQHGGDSSFTDLTPETPTKLLFGDLNQYKKQQNNADQANKPNNGKIFNYFQFQNKNKFEHAQTLKKLMKLKKSKEVKKQLTTTTPIVDELSDSVNSYSTSRINHFFPKIDLNKSLELSHATEYSRQRQHQQRRELKTKSELDKQMTNLDEVSFINVKQNQIDTEKELNDLNEDSVFKNVKNFVESSNLSVQRKRGMKYALPDPQAHSSLISFNQNQQSSSMNNLLASSTATLITRRLPSLHSINLTSDHERKTYYRYSHVVNEDASTSSSSKQLQMSTNSLRPATVKTTVSRRPATTKNTSQEIDSDENNDVDDDNENYYKSTLLLNDEYNEDFNSSSIVIKIPSIKKRVQFAKNKQHHQ